jgi:hypothetical protein
LIPDPMRPAWTASIELGATLRYTGSRLWAVDRAFRGVVATSSAALGFILNISKA